MRCRVDCWAPLAELDYELPAWLSGGLMCKLWGELLSAILGNFPGEPPDGLQDKLMGKL